MSFTFCLSLRTNQMGPSIRFLNTFSHDEVPSRFQLWILASLYSRLIRRNRLDRKYIRYQTHFLSRYTSHDPSSPVPPHGPLRIRLGQFWQQMNAVEDKMHSPQCWQWNTGTFTISSKKSKSFENFRSRGVKGGLSKVANSFGKGIPCS